MFQHRLLYQSYTVGRSYNLLLQSNGLVAILGLKTQKYSVDQKDGGIAQQLYITRRFTLSQFPLLRFPVYFHLFFFVRQKQYDFTRFLRTNIT